MTLGDTGISKAFLPQYTSPMAMRSSEKRLRLLILGLTAVLPAASGDWVPLRAEFRTITTRNDGVVIRELREIFVRDAAGNELRTRAVMTDGVVGPVTDGDFLDSRSGSLHELNYPRKRAILKIPGGTPRAHMNPAGGYDLGSRMIQGLVCLGSSIVDPANPNRKFGAMWDYVPYDLVVRVELSAPGSDSQTVTELVRVDTQGGAMGPVRIPEDFTLVTELEQSPSCDRSK
jgi:hypothetical protein